MRFSIAVWLATRALIFAAIAVGAHAMPSGLGNWDGAWYGSIAAHGYEYARDGAQHNVAFFPFFPLAALLLMHAGIPWPIAGAVVANAAFLAGTLLFYAYARRRFGTAAARWSVAALCVSPLSLFCSVAYSEGVFIFFAALAFWAYDRERFALAAFAAAGASATRPLGAALAAALLVASLVERRGVRASLQIAAGFCGLGAFMAYCALRFGDALAFAHAQFAWRHAAGFAPNAWIGLARGALGGRPHDWITIISIAAAVAGIAWYRRTLGAANTAFLALALAVLLFAGTPLSADRNLYAVLPVALTLAFWLRRVPAVGYAAAALSLALLAADAVAFARFQWVA